MAPYLATLSTPIAVPLLSWIGVVSAVAWFGVMFLTPGLGATASLPIGVLCMLSYVSAFVILRRSRIALVRSFGERVRDYCPVCCYDMVGVESASACPECGVVSDPRTRYHVWQASFIGHPLPWLAGSTEAAPGRWSRALATSRAGPPFLIDRQPVLRIAAFLIALVAALAVWVGPSATAPRPFGFPGLIPLLYGVAGIGLLHVARPGMRRVYARRAVIARATRVCPACLGSVESQSEAPCCGCGFVSSPASRFACWREAFPKAKLGPLQEEPPL
ncbi:MAG: hypothetical protein AAF138_03215 [Planctomycetota bacterium]